MRNTTSGRSATATIAAQKALRIATHPAVIVGMSAAARTSRTACS